MMAASAPMVGPLRRGGTSMERSIGTDVSLELGSVCVLDAAGAVVREAKVPSEPEAQVGFTAELDVPIASVGLEAGPPSAWLHDGLRAAGHEVALLGTRQSQPRA